MRRGRQPLIWAALLALALAARFAALVVVSDYAPPWLWEVEIMAKSLVERGVLAYDFYGLTPLLPTAFLPPVYPLFVAATWAIAGPDYPLVLRLLQIGLSTVSVALLVPLAGNLTRSPRAGWLAGFIAAVYPSFVVGAVQVNTVTLEVLFVEVFAWFLLTWAGRPAFGRLAAAGLALGLLVLTRGPALLLWLVVGFWLLVVYPSRALHRRVAWIAVFSLFLLLPQLPWAVRNARAVGSPVTVATNGGLNFWVGHNPAADAEYAWPLDTDRALAERLAPLSEPERDQVYYELGWQYALSHPVEEVRLSLRKLWYFFWFRPNLGSSYPNADRFQAVAQLGLMVGYGVVALGALLGAWVCRRDWRRLFVIYGIWPVYAGAAVLYFVATRFRAPVEPFLIAFAGAGIVWLAARFRVKDPVVEAAGQSAGAPGWEGAGE